MASPSLLPKGLYRKRARSPVSDLSPRKVLPQRCGACLGIGTKTSRFLACLILPPLLLDTVELTEGSRWAKRALPPPYEVYSETELRTSQSHVYHIHPPHHLDIAGPIVDSQWLRMALRPPCEGCLETKTRSHRVYLFPQPHHDIAVVADLDLPSHLSVPLKLDPPHHPLNSFKRCLVERL